MKDLFSTLSLKELFTGFGLFLGIFLIVFVSRNSRLNSTDAVFFSEETHLYLREEMTINELAQQLLQFDVDLDEQEMYWASRILGWRYFKTGHYLLGGSYSYDELLSKLSLGSQDPVKVTILPGIDIGRFSRNVAAQMKFDSTEIASVFSDSVYLSRKGVSKELLFGKMLPDTYDLYWSSSPESVVDRILDEFQTKVVDRYSDTISQLEYSLEEILTMASIVEWEAKIEEEKPVISGLYWNRLKRRMLLQADPTVNYALGERRRLLFEDYTVDHPFNTYTNKGLPPGPITNPSLSTIEATIFPAEHDYLYMVANPEGGHVFTKTFEEHQVESEKWRRWLRQQYRIKRQQEADRQSGTDR